MLENLENSDDELDENSEMNDNKKDEITISAA